MIYLAEQQIAFDTNEIGFPSVNGCRAIVLVTAGRLYGFHLLGVMTLDKRNAFVNFVNPPGGAAHPVINIYCASKAQGAEAVAARGEVTTLAGALGYAGRIYWSDLSGVGLLGAYVNFFRPTDKCVIQARPWNDAVDGAAANKGPYHAANRIMAIGAAPAQMFTNVNPAGLVTVYPAPIN